MTTILPTDRAIYYCATGAGDLIIGTTQPGELTGVNPALDVISAESEAEFVHALPTEAFDALPDAGTWLEADMIYSYDGGCVMVRQSHIRTEHDPADVPNLFVVWREDADEVLDWVAGESVVVGTRRTYDGDTYTCLQAHVTQADWTPDAVPALWALVTPPTAEWAVGVAYTGDNTVGAGNGDVVTYLGSEYRCLQSHTSLAGWTPIAVPALWLAL